MTSATHLTLGGRYHLVERIAVGGMGEVWRAEDEVLGRNVAIKVLREEHAHDPQFRQRFRAEAQHAAMLVHPNVAQVFDFNEGDDGNGDPPYLVMELIRGEPLSAVLEREAPLDADRTWAILGQAASALSAAHAAGVVHRDIKPGNLLICPDGQLKVTDFGIARATGSAAVTTAGVLLGTPHYLSPEQVAGEPVSAASDFYALGAVAYECLTGHRLYDGDAVAVLVAHRDQEPPPLPAGIPAGLRDLVTAMLDKDPAKRPTDGRAIAAQAERFNQPTVSIPVLADPYPSASPSQAAPVVPGAPETAALTAPPSARERRRRPWLLPAVAAAVAALLLIGGIVVLTQRGGTAAQVPTAKKPAPAPVAVKVQQVTPYDGTVGSGGHPEEASLAADGSTGTAWYTQHYATAAFGQLRTATGLLFDLGHPVAVKTLQLRLAVPGVDLQVHAGNSTDALESAATVQTVKNAGRTLELHPTQTARYWLVWFTRLAPNDGGYRAGVAEATFSR